MSKLFPERLNQGSQGRAVAVLQILLISGGWNDGITIDGDYGEQTAAGVKALQDDLGFEGDDIDGNFGPKTRAAYMVSYGLDVNAIDAAPFLIETHAVG